MSKKQNQEIQNPIPKDLFDIVACPLCKADLEYTKDKKGLVCSKCGEKYPIEDGIPVLYPALRQP
ncbi:Trm112 family protein [Candidatus Woesearchaeota archaeon]|nr:Trm112 family protein [Candidatus Woesearchaeota archaeon]